MIAVVIAALAAPGEARAGRMPQPVFHVVDQPCPADPTAACSYPETDTIYLGPMTFATYLEHEKGHLFDAQFLNDGDRHWFTRAFHLHARSWSGDATDDDGQPAGAPNEVFADMYMACDLGLVPPRHPARWVDVPGKADPWPIPSGYTPPRPRLARLCSAIVRVGERTPAP